MIHSKIFKKWWLCFVLLLFCIVCLFISRFSSEKLDDIDLKQPRVRFSTTSENMDKTTTIFSLENKSFELLQQRISRRGTSARNFLVSGIFLIERAGTYFFSLNANRAARLIIDGEDVSRSNIFEKELNQIVPLYLQNGVHPFSLHYTPSTQGAYLQLLWKYNIGGDFQHIPSDVVFSSLAPSRWAKIIKNPAKPSFG
ncbi:hypothetical protein ACFLRW_06650 [Acidobacteriota bacterium]